MVVVQTVSRTVIPTASVGDVERYPADHPRPDPPLYVPSLLDVLSIHPPKQDVEHAVLHEVKHFPIHPASQHSVFLLG